MKLSITIVDADQHKTKKSKKTMRGRKLIVYLAEQSFQG
jgi:hypothetical protein